MFWPLGEGSLLRGNESVESGGEAAADEEDVGRTKRDLLRCSYPEEVRERDGCLCERGESDRVFFGPGVEIEEDTATDNAARGGTSWENMLVVGEMEEGKGKRQTVNAEGGRRADLGLGGIVVIASFS